MSNLLDIECFMNIITKYSNIAVVKYGSTKVLREQVTKLSLRNWAREGKEEPL